MPTRTQDIHPLHEQRTVRLVTTVRHRVGTTGPGDALDVRHALTARWALPLAHVLSLLGSREE